MAYRNLLLIDDDEDDQEIFISAVSAVSDRVKSTAIFSGIEALEKLSQKTIQPDVIFLDLNMPVMNGQQFLTQIKKHPDLKDIPVIIFSTSSQRSTIEAVKELGARDFITKPGLFNELVNVLRPLLT